MKTLIITFLFVVLTYASSTPVLNIKDISKENDCRSEFACVELSILVLEEISKLKVIVERVEVDENHNVIKVLTRKEESISASSQDAFLYEISSDLAQAKVENYRINIEVVYLKTGKKVESGFQNVNFN